MALNLVEAEDICSKKMKDQLGKRLLRFHLDTHSSRIDDKAAMYRLYFKADVGALNKFNEISIHCFVELDDGDIYHYRQYNENSPTWRSKIKFF